MSNQVPTTIDLQRALEATRQERETFELRKKHEERWFLLRFVMGWVSVALIIGIMVVSCLILVNSPVYSDKVVIGALIALFVDILGLAIAVWRIVLNPSFVTRLEPITRHQSYPSLTTDNDSGKEH